MTTQLQLVRLTEAERSEDTIISNAVSQTRAKRNAPKKKAVAVGKHGLTEEEVKNCHIFFKRHDRNKNDNIDIWELQTALTCMGQKTTEEETKAIMLKLDVNGNGTLEFSEFCEALAIQKENERKNSPLADLVMAFVSLGGNPDKSGNINAELVRKVIKDEFQLTVKIDELLEEMDQSNDGLIDFNEFKGLLAM